MTESPEHCWLPRAELAKRWRMPEATLSQWGSQKRGPKYARFGRHVRYRLSDVIAFENAQLNGREVD
ncbi:helix-turn-helix transcriptional regulator [Mycobacterium novum]